MKYKLLFIFALFGSVQVNANQRDFYDSGYNAGDYRYRNRTTNSRKFYNSDFDNSEYEYKNKNSVRFYNTGSFGWGFKYMKGKAENNGNKVSLEHMVMSPLIRAGLGIVFDKENSLFQQIRVAGEFSFLPTGETGSAILNGRLIEDKTEVDASRNLTLNSYWNFNDITDGVSLYLSVGIGRWGRRFVENKDEIDMSASSLQFGFGVSSKVSETLYIDTALNYLVTADFEKKGITCFEKELGIGVAVRSLF